MVAVVNVAIVMAAVIIAVMVVVTMRGPDLHNDLRISRPRRRCESKKHTQT
jgi:hypothetical protein